MPWQGALGKPVRLWRRWSARRLLNTSRVVRMRRPRAGRETPPLLLSASSSFRRGMSH